MSEQNSLHHHASFVRFFWGDIATQLGRSVFVIVVPLIAVNSLEATAFEVGILYACGRLPFLFFSLSAGVHADKLEKRQILIFSSFVRFSILIICVALAWTDFLSILLLGFALFIIGVANVYFEVTYWTYTPSLLPPKLVARGNGALASISSAVELIGPALAGFFLKISGIGGALLLNSTLFFLGGAILFSTPPSLPKNREEKSSAIFQIRAGISALFSSPVIRRLVIIGSSWNILACSATPQIVVYLSRHIGFTEASIGLILGMLGFGGMIGALSANKMRERLGHGRSILVGAVIYSFFSLTICLFSTPSQINSLLLGSVLFVAGWGSSIGIVNIVTLRLLMSPETLRGRIDASFRFITWGLMPLSMVAGGAISEIYGSRLMIGFASAAGFMLVLLTYRNSIVTLAGKR